MSNLLDNIAYFGDYIHTLDAQRRIALRSGWRSKSNAETFYLVPGRGKYLQLMPHEYFADFIEKARKVSFANHSAQMKLAQFASRVKECKMDKSGRIQFPADMLALAEISNEAMLVGSFSTIQVWNPENWEAEKNATSDESVLDEIQRISESKDDSIDGFLQALGGKA